MSFPSQSSSLTQTLVLGGRDSKASDERTQCRETTQKGCLRHPHERTRYEGGHPRGCLRYPHERTRYEGGHPRPPNKENHYFYIFPIWSTLFGKLYSKSVNLHELIKKNS